VAPDVDERLTMQSPHEVALGLAAVGVIAAGASAFTATSTIDNPAVHVRSVAQSISGASGRMGNLRQMRVVSIARSRIR
jgi:hypothetical protein